MDPSWGALSTVAGTAVKPCPKDTRNFINFTNFMNLINLLFDFREVEHQRVKILHRELVRFTPSGMQLVVV